MSYRNREIESKLIVRDATLNDVHNALYALFNGQPKKMIFGSSVDTYWTIPDPEVEADFIRMRERDGCVQITTKGKDKGNNRNRMEREYITTDPVPVVQGVLTSAHGKPAGIVGKTYYVYWPESNEHTTVCCYSIEHVTPKYKPIIVEVETTTMHKLDVLEARVIEALTDLARDVEHAPGSLYEMFVLGKRGDV